MSIKVVADNHLRAAAVDDFIAAAGQLVTETQAKDQGCLAYGLYRDKADPLHLTVIEEWASQEALDQHLASEHFQRLFPHFEAAADPSQPGVIAVYEAVL
jgi:quinol monooxygenase YgiN